MPEKSRQQRVKASLKRGAAKAIKSSDVGLARGLSRHAAKKSSHVEGLRTGLPDRKVKAAHAPPQSRKSAPPGRRELNEDLPRAVAIPNEGKRVLSRRSRSQVAARLARKKK